MKKNSFLSMPILIVGIMLAFGLVSCQPEPEEDKPLPAGTYTTTAKQETVTYGLPDNLAVVKTRLDGIESPSFTVDANGVVTALSLGGGGSGFITWVSDSGTKYRFTLSGNNLNFQVKQANDFAPWSPTVSISGVDYKQSIGGSFNSGTVSLKLQYERANAGGSAHRFYTLKKQ